MERLRELIWYGVVLVVLFGAYHVATSYGIALADREFGYMQPTVEPGSMCFIDRRAGPGRALEMYDVIAFEVYQKDKVKRFFGRVLAMPGSTVYVRTESKEKKLIVGGDEVATAPKGLADLLRTGLIVPRDTVFVGFDRSDAKFPLSQRLVPYRNVIGRVMGK